MAGDPSPTYVVVHLQIHDRDVYRAYEAGFLPILARHDGELAGFVDGPDALEGDAPEGRVVVLRFPSREAAEAWYSSAEYQELAEIRRSASTMRLSAFVPALDLRG